MQLKKLLPFVFSFYLVGLAGSMSFMEIGSTLLFLVVLLSPYRKSISFNVPLAKRVILFLIVMAIGIALGNATAKEKIYDFGRMRFFFLYFVLYSVLLTETKKSYWLNVLRCVTGIIGVYGFVQHFVAIDLIRPEGKKVLLYALQDEKIGPLVVGTFNHHLTFSNSYLFFSCLFLSIGFSDPKKRWIDLSLGAFLFLLVFWTQSRVAWVAIPICLVLLSYFHFGKKVFLGSVLATAAVVVALYASNPSFQERLSKTFQMNDHRSFLPRVHLWKAQIAMWKESPVFGVGWNNNERRSKEYVDRLYPGQSEPFYGHAHSILFQILATTGIVGFIAFLWLWMGVFQTSVRAVLINGGVEKAVAIGALASFVGFWIQGLTQWNFGDAEVLHTVIFFWALVASLNSK